MTDAGDILTPLLTLPRFGSGARSGLERTADLARDVLASDFIAGLDAIRITGTNGKGSVAVMVERILAAAGVDAGLTTSPHLFDFRERIVRGGRPIETAELETAARWLNEQIRRLDATYPDEQIGAFEATTALALDHFCRVRPETVVAEVGIGGRYDPSRLFPGRCNVLVSLDLEHTALLGTTLEEIADDKALLADPGSVLLVGTLPSGILRRLREDGERRDVEVVAASEVCNLTRTRYAEGRMYVDLTYQDEPWDDIEVALVGEHQAANAALAVVVAGRWLARHRPRLDSTGLEKAVRQGLAAVRWPCRLERLSEDPPLYVDAGHTPAALAALADSVDKLLAGEKVILVLGVSEDKDVLGIASPLLPLARRVIATRASHRGGPASVVAEVVRSQAPELAVTVEDDLEQALAMAQDVGRSEGATVLVAGGLFLAVETAALCRRFPDRRRF
jgi:dihydrofolate synthase/folylpolyglutamate synthase